MDSQYFGSFLSQPAAISCVVHGRRGATSGTTRGATQRASSSQIPPIMDNFCTTFGNPGQSVAKRVVVARERPTTAMIAIQQVDDFLAEEALMEEPPGSTIEQLTKQFKALQYLSQRFHDEKQALTYDNERLRSKVAAAIKLFKQ